MDNSNKMSAYNTLKKNFTMYCPYKKKNIFDAKLIDYNVVRTDINNILIKPVVNFNDFKKTSQTNSDNIIEYLNTTDYEINVAIESNDIFWNIVNQISYYDRDEYCMVASDIRYNMQEKSHLLRIIDMIFIPILNEKLSILSLPFAINTGTYNNFMTHIIFKGKGFYKSVIETPSLCLYLTLDTINTIYDWLNV